MSLACVVALAAVLMLSACGGSDQSQSGPAGAKAQPVEVGRNVARVSGRSPADVAGAAVLATYPPGGANPNGVVIVRPDQWRQTMVAAQFAAKPVGAAILPTESQFLPTASFDVLSRLHPPGFPRASGIQALVIGHVGGDVFGDLKGDNYKLTQLKARSDDKLVATTVPYRGGWAHNYADEVVVVSSRKRDRPYALPAAAWSAYSGDTLAFVDPRRGVPAPTRALLVQRQKLRLQRPTVYLIGPRSVIPDSVAHELSAYGTVKRVAGRNPVETSVALARYRDPKTGFGWGVTSAPASVSLVNLNDWGNAIGAFNFAAAGPQAPLLLTDSPTELPLPVRRYLDEIRGGQPSQAMAFGDQRSIATATLADLDGLLDPR
jgi:hypothetical protein